MSREKEKICSIQFNIRSLIVHGLLVLSMAAFLPITKAEQYVVSVQSQDQDSMEALTKKVDAEVMLGASGASRVTLGAIEATMSRVVDSDSPFVVGNPPSIPSMALLNDITYDESSTSWTLQYQTEQSDSADELNHFSRILYASKQGSVQLGDLHNPCLSQSAGASCVAALKSDYIVADDAVAGADSLTLQTTSVNNAIAVSNGFCQ